jgi:hypothetical protein
LVSFRKRGDVSIKPWLLVRFTRCHDVGVLAGGWRTHQEIEAAATKIQAIQKGRMARQEVALMKAAAIRKAEAAAAAGADVGEYVSCVKLGSWAKHLQDPPNHLSLMACITDMATAKEKKLAQMKRHALRTWEPEYCPESIVPPSESVNTITTRSTRVSLPLILADQITM